MCVSYHSVAFFWSSFPPWFGCVVLFSFTPLVILLKSQMLLWPTLICWCSVSALPRAGLILVLSLLQATHTGMRSYIYKQSSVIGSQAEHTGMRTYYFSADTQEDMNGWVRAMNQAALMQTHTVKRSVSHKTFSYSVFWSFWPGWLSLKQDECTSEELTLENISLTFDIKHKTHNVIW